MGSTAAPAVAIGALADGIFAQLVVPVYSCVSRVRRGGALNSARGGRAPQSIIAFSTTV